MAKQFNGCTSNCGSVCDYIVELSDGEFSETIESLVYIGAMTAAESLRSLIQERKLAIVDLKSNESEYQRLKAVIDKKKYESEDWQGWYK